jgi:hypothetical protein
MVKSPAKLAVGVRDQRDAHVLPPSAPPVPHPLDLVPFRDAWVNPDYGTRGDPARLRDVRRVRGGEDNDFEGSLEVRKHGFLSRGNEDRHLRKPLADPKPGAPIEDRGIASEP